MINTKKLHISLFSIIFLINLSCANKDKYEQNKKSQVSQNPLNIYSKLDVCGCNKEANEIIDLVKDIRETHTTLEDLKKQKESVSEIRRLASNYSKLLESCFTNHATKMFVPSDCNNLNELERKKSELSNLGIQIEQGERMKL